MVWNRISLIFKPTVSLNQDDMASISKRLSPWAPGLGLEKVVVMANFVGKNRPDDKARFMAVEWSDPTSRGSLLSIVKPWQRPHRVLSAYEQRVVEARRANKFFPYELVRTLTSDETGAGFGKGTFEELDLSPMALILCQSKSVHGEKTKPTLWSVRSTMFMRVSRVAWSVF